MNQIDWLVEAYGLTPGPLFQTMNIQDVGGLRKTIETGIGRSRPCCRWSTKPSARRPGFGADGGAAMRRLGRLVGRHRQPRRRPRLRPAGAQGGTGVLAETPEIYGAEHLLTARAVDREVGEKLVGLIRWWEDYTARNKGSMDNNPSPGNKKGGLTTILEKSLGAAAKGGTTPLTGVYKYAEPVTAAASPSWTAPATTRPR
jgi:altronate hydrolase